MPHYPEVTIELGEAVNPAALRDLVQRKMRLCGLPEEVVAKYLSEANSDPDDPAHVLATTIKYVWVE